MSRVVTLASRWKIWQARSIVTLSRSRRFIKQCKGEFWTAIRFLVGQHVSQLVRTLATQERAQSQLQSGRELSGPVKKNLPKLMNVTARHAMSRQIQIQIQITLSLRTMRNLLKLFKPQPPCRTARVSPHLLLRHRQQGLMTSALPCLATGSQTPS